MKGSYACIILAAAGLRRLGLEERITALLEPEDSLPAVGQGALGIECREERADLAELLAPLDHPETAWCVRAERAVSRALAGSCVVPLGAYARREVDGIRLRGFVASPDGARMVRGRGRVLVDRAATPRAWGSSWRSSLPRAARARFSRRCPMSEPAAPGGAAAGRPGRPGDAPGRTG